jgi:hypothetical protein
MEIQAQAERDSGVGLKLFGFIAESMFTFIPESRSRSPGFPTIMAWAAKNGAPTALRGCRKLTILRERVRAGLDHARQQGKRLGRPPSVVHYAPEAQTLFRQGLSKSEIARLLNIGRTSVRRLLIKRKP